MNLKKEMDLIGVVSPVCLLKCKSVLGEMNAGDMLDILLKDPEVVGELVKIIERSQDRVVQSQRDGDHYRVSIIKSENQTRR
jgi:TusA-related sulfurtransferase